MSEINTSNIFDTLRIMQREGILHGISWHKYQTANVQPGYCASELHIGSLKIFRLHLSTGTGTTEYFMQLREMVVVPEYDEGADVTAAVPQYVILIPNTRIVADDLDEAKCIAVEKVMEYISAVHKAANERYESMVDLFGDLNKVLREKTARSRACEPIELLGLTGRSLKKLQDGGVRLIGELVTKTKADVKKMPGIGNDSLNDILTCLHKANLALADETSSGITTHDLNAADAARQAAEKAAEQTDKADEGACADETGTPDGGQDVHPEEQPPVE